MFYCHRHLIFTVDMRNIFAVFLCKKHELSESNLSKRAKYTQICYSLLANFPIVSSGMGLGFSAITTQLLATDTEVILTESQISWFASVTAIACPFGGPISAFLTNKFGRKGTLMIVNVVCIIMWTIIGFSSRSNPQVLFIQLMFGRVLTGLTIGMITTPTVMYTSEICHPMLRGRMTILSTPFFISLGSLMIYTLGYLIQEDYRLVAIWTLGITVASIFIYFFIPESPVHLVYKSKIKEARSVLSAIRDLPTTDPKIDEEILQIQQNFRSSTTSVSKLQAFKEFTEPQLYKPFMIMLTFFTIQQLSGAFVIFVYAAQFSIEAGVSIDAFLSAVIVGAVRTVTTLGIAFISDKVGRKPMALVSSIGMFCSMTGLVLCAVFQLTETAFFWLPAALLYFFVFIGTTGILTLPFSMVAEMYPQKSRSLAVGITMSYCFFLSFLTIKTFSTVFDLFGSAIIFSFYAIISLIGVFFSIYILPETKGKTLQEIENYFRK